jgi:hypothetical protein
MENNNDFLTNVFRQKIDDMKKEKGSSNEETDKTAAALITLILAIGKWIFLTVFSWLGWKLAAEVFAIPQLTYLQVVGIMVGIRSFSMLIISPLIPKKSV